MAGKCENKKLQLNQRMVWFIPDGKKIHEPVM